DASKAVMYQVSRRADTEPGAQMPEPPPRTKFMPEILHIVPRPQWDKAVAAGEYRAESLATEGFLHASTAAQLLKVANTFYSGQKGLVVLKIDPAKVRAPIRWENPPGLSEQFPHIYGPLNLDAVVDVLPFEPNASGLFDPIC